MRVATFTLRLSRHRIALWGAALATCNLFLLAATASDMQFADSVWWPVRYGAQQLDLRFENNIAAWYSSMLLLMVAVAQAGCFAIARRTRHGAFRHAQVGWLVMAVLFAGLALDELGSLHERIDAAALAAISIRAPGWLAVLTVPIALVGALMLWFAWSTLRGSPVPLALMTIGVLLLLSIPAQEAFEAAQTAAGASRSVWHVVLEEGSEILASTAMLVGALWFLLERAAPGPARGGEVIRFTPAMRTVFALEAVLALGLIATLVALPRMVDVADGRGIPHDWFPSALAALVALYACSRARGRERLSWWFVAAVHLALSIDLGSAHSFSERLLAGTAMARGALDAMIIAVILIAGAALWRLPSANARVAAMAWTLLLVVAQAAGGDAGVVLSFAACALLLPALLYGTATGAIDSGFGTAAIDVSVAGGASSASARWRTSDE